MGLNHMYRTSEAKLHWWKNSRKQNKAQTSGTSPGSDNKAEHHLNNNLHSLSVLSMPRSPSMCYGSQQGKYLSNKLFLVQFSFLKNTGESSEGWRHGPMLFSSQFSSFITRSENQKNIYVKLSRKSDLFRPPFWFLCCSIYKHIIIYLLCIINIIHIYYLNWLPWNLSPYPPSVLIFYFTGDLRACKSTFQFNHGLKRHLFISIGFSL